jgi:hypothetical protein
MSDIDYVSEIVDKFVEQIHAEKVKFLGLIHTRFIKGTIRDENVYGRDLKIVAHKATGSKMKLTISPVSKQVRVKFPAGSDSTTKLAVHHALTLFLKDYADYVFRHSMRGSINIYQGHVNFDVRCENRSNSQYEKISFSTRSIVDWGVNS